MEVKTNNVPLQVEASNGPERSTKKNGKEEKSRRKDDKSVEQVMKALNVLETTEEKLAAMCKKYTEIVDENRKLQLSAKQWEKGLHTVQREKEQLQTDHSKAVLTRSRLESLCRELQRQNKQIKEESLQKIREEEEKRKEVSAKFNTTLAEITTLMSSSNEKTNMLRDENVEITKKFKSICDQSSIQQQQVDKMNTQRKLESELTEARLTKQRLEFTAEKEILLKEKQELFMDIHSLHARINELEGSETSLKGQVTLYADRYDEFQTALTKSNEVFGGFKGEMEKMSKKITRLEKETSTWKGRWEKSHQSFLEVVAEKAKCEGELALANRKHAQLEKLCRTLQTERVLLLAQIKGLSQSPSNDSSIETTTAHIENTLASAAVQQVACSMGKVTAESLKLVTDESSSEKVTAAIESLNIEPVNSENLEKLHTNFSEATNTAQDACDSFANIVGMNEENAVGLIDDVSVELPPVLPCGDSSKNQADVNALTIDKTPAIHVDGGNNSCNASVSANVGNSAVKNNGGKMGDFQTVHKKGAKSHTVVKDVNSDTVKKTKPLSGNDVRSDKGERKGTPKDNRENVNVQGVNKTKVEVSSDKKDKKGKGDKGSLKEKNEIDSSNEGQKKGNTDTNKVVELTSEEKQDESKLREVSETNEPAKNSDTETNASLGSTNKMSLFKSTEMDKKETIFETILISDSIVSSAEEKKGTAQIHEFCLPDKKPEFEKKVKNQGTTNKMAHEKKHSDKVELGGTDNSSSKENKVTEFQGSSLKDVPDKDLSVEKVQCQVSNVELTFGMEVTQGLGSNIEQKDFCSEGKKDVSKLEGESNDKTSSINALPPSPSKEVILNEMAINDKGDNVDTSSEGKKDLSKLEGESNDKTSSINALPPSPTKEVIVNEMVINDKGDNVDTSSEGKKDVSKLDGESNDKMPSPNALPPSPSKEVIVDEMVINDKGDNVDTSSEGKTVGDTEVPAKGPEMETVKDVGLTEKIPPALSKDMKKTKKPEKPKRSDKKQVEANIITAEDGADKISTETAQYSEPKNLDGDKNVESNIDLQSSPASESKVDRVDSSQATPVVTAPPEPVTPGEDVHGPETVVPPKSEANPNVHQHSDVKKEKVVAKKRKK